MSAPKYLLGTHDLCIPKRKKRSKDRESRQVLLTSRVCISAKSLHLCLIPCSPTTAARQAPLSMEFSRQEYGSGLPCPSRGSSQSRDQTCISCVSHIRRQVLYRQCHLGSPGTKRAVLSKKSSQKFHTFFIPILSVRKLVTWQHVAARRIGNCGHLSVII